MKKFVLSLGSVAAVVAPIASVISCGSDEVSSSVVRLQSTTNILGTTRSTDDIAVEGFESVIVENKENLEALKDKVVGNEKVKLELAYADALIAFDMQIKSTGSNKFKVMINKVYLEPKTGDKLEDAAIKGTKISTFKDYARKFIYSLLVLEKGKTAEEAKDAVISSIANPANLEA